MNHFCSEDLAHSLALYPFTSSGCFILIAIGALIIALRSPPFHLPYPSRPICIEDMPGYFSVTDGV